MRGVGCEYRKENGGEMRCEKEGVLCELGGMREDGGGLREVSEVQIWIRIRGT